MRGPANDINIEKVRDLELGLVHKSVTESKVPANRTLDGNSAQIQVEPLNDVLAHLDMVLPKKSGCDGCNKQSKGKSSSPFPPPTWSQALYAPSKSLSSQHCVSIRQPNSAKWVCEKLHDGRKAMIDLEALTYYPTEPSSFDGFGVHPEKTASVDTRKPKCKRIIVSDDEMDIGEGSTVDECDD